MTARIERPLCVWSFSSTFPPSWPVSYFRAGAGRLSERDQSAVGLPLFLSCNGCRRQWRRMSEATPLQSKWCGKFSAPSGGEAQSGQGRSGSASGERLPALALPLLTPATSLPSTPSPKTSTHTASWSRMILPSVAFLPCLLSWPTGPLSCASIPVLRQTPVRRRA